MGTGVEEKNFVEHQNEVKGKYYVKKKVGLDFTEEDEILVHQQNNQADDRDQILHDKGYLGEPIEKFYHQRIELFAPVMQYFQRKIGIEHTQGQNR